MRKDLAAAALSLGALLGLALAPGGAGGTLHDAADDGALAWVHASVTDEMQNFPETNGSGACWGDIDGDGVDDLFLVNGLFANATRNAAVDPRSALYLNRGDGGFLDVSSQWNADVSGWGQGCAMPDYDGDGDLDLIVVGYDLIVMLRNDGDTFRDVTAESNLRLEGNCDDEPHCFGETASWADYDGDGDLDVYITQYGDYDIDVGGPVAPVHVDGMSNILFANNGDGTFTDVTDLAGVRDDPGPQRSKSFQSAWADYDRDGDPDLYIASDTTPNTLFRNDGDGTFTDVATAAGVDDWGASMGLVFQDIDHDGLPDLYFTHYETEHNGFYLNNGNGTFSKRSGQGGLATDLDEVGWGVAAEDFDNDGFSDIFVVNGHTYNFSQLNGDAEHKQKPLLYRGNGDGTFEDISASSGPAFQVGSVGRGAPVADADLDGDLDVVLVAQYNESVRLLRNDGDDGHHLQVQVRQPDGMNRFAVGAEVQVTPQGGVPLMRIIQAGSGFLGQDSQVVHAGLGDAPRADVTVRWPDGSSQTFLGVAADQRIAITKGSPVLRTDTISPWTDFVLDGPGTVRGWYNDAVEVSLDARDRGAGATGVRSVEIDPGDGWRAYTGPVTFAADGEHIVRARATDHAGNQEPVRTQHIGIDRTAPTTSVDLQGIAGTDGWWRDTVTVRLTATDNLAGVHQTRYRVDDQDWVQGDRLTLDQSGTYAVAFQSTDAAGNVEPVQEIEVRVDADDPRGQLDAWPVALGVDHAALRMDVRDRTSGVRSVAFFVDDETLPRHVDTDGADGWTWQMRGDPGRYTVTAVARDAVDHTVTDRAPVLLLAGGLWPAGGLAGLFVALPIARRFRAGRGRACGRRSGSSLPYDRNSL